MAALMLAAALGTDPTVAAPGAGAKADPTLAAPGTGALRDAVMEFGGFAPDEKEYAYKLRRSYTDGSSKESWHLYRTERSATGLAKPRGVRLEKQRFPAYLTQNNYRHKTITGQSSGDRTRWDFAVPGAGTLSAELKTEKVMVLQLTLQREDGRKQDLGRVVLTDIWFDLEATLHLAPSGRKAALVATFNGDIYRRSETYILVLY
jgi:hypothetical protein